MDDFPSPMNDVNNEGISFPGNSYSAIFVIVTI